MAQQRFVNAATRLGARRKLAWIVVSPVLAAVVTLSTATGAGAAWRYQQVGSGKLIVDAKCSTYAIRTTDMIPSNTSGGIWIQTTVGRAYAEQDSAPQSVAYQIWIRDGNEQYYNATGGWVAYTLQAGVSRAVFTNWYLKSAGSYHEVIVDAAYLQPDKTWRYSRWQVDDFQQDFLYKRLTTCST